MATKIEWATETWNPITGCSPISEGCENCYAERMAQRLNGRYGYPADEPFRVTYHPDRLEQPLKWKKPRRIFTCSMGDIFHDGVQVDWIDSIVGIMEQCKHHTFIILTKRPENIEEKVFAYYHNEVRRLFESGFPDNIWLGVTAENQKRADERIPILLQIPAAVRFASVEPMLEPIDIEHFLVEYHHISDNREVHRNKINWLICGAETGHSARRMYPEWAHDLFYQCKSAGVPFFFKKASKGDEINFPREYPRRTR